MPLYNVLVTVEATAHTLVEVEAKSVAEAERKGLDQVRHGSEKWSLDEDSVHDNLAYIADPGGCAFQIDRAGKRIKE